MKFSKKYYLIIFILIAAVVSGFVFSGRKKQPAPSLTQQTEPIIDNTLKETPADLMAPETPAELRTFDFQITQTSSTVSISWDESKIKIFSVMLMDIEEYNLQAEQDKIIVWAITSVPPENLSKVGETKSFLSSPYFIGEKKEGFSHFREGQPVLEKGKEYWLQITGLDNDRQVKFTSKTFTFGK